MLTIDTTQSEVIKMATIDATDEIAVVDLSKAFNFNKSILVFA
jgi:hypothetical protein